jgi:hypothetical protein
MRIGEPARKHGVSDADILHAVRNSMRWVEVDDDLTMLIGAAIDGALLEVASSTSKATIPWHSRHAAAAEVPQVPL